MSKSKGVKPVKATDSLTKVKAASVTKPAQSVKSKSKEMAKAIGKKPEIKKKVKEPTPEPSSEEEESESSASESESESESEAKTKSALNGKANGVKLASKAEESDDDSDESDSDAGSDSDESESKVVRAKPSLKTKDIPATDGNESDTEASDSDESTAAEDDSDASSTEDESDDEVPAVSAVMGAQLKKGEKIEEEDSDDSSEESEIDEKISAKAASKAAPKANGVAKKPEPESGDESAEDSDDESSDGDDSSDESEEEAKPKSTKRKAEDEAPAPAKKTKVDDADPTKKTLFVGNLSWNVTEEWLQQEFEEFGTVIGCRIVTERPSGKSKGYGYVDFEQAADAAKAHKAKAGTELDGRPLNVDFANARPSNEARQDSRRSAHGDNIGQPTDTLFIGNMSFDADQDSISSLFQPHGTILGVRIPTNYETGGPKGYAYVTFSSVDEAQAALDAMQGGYLNGRPMRLDFSQPRPQNGDGGQRGGFGGRGRGGNDRGGRGGFSRGGRGGGFDRGGRGGGFDRGGRGGRGARGGGRGGSTNRGGFGDFKGQKVSFD